MVELVEEDDRHHLYYYPYIPYTFPRANHTLPRLFVSQWLIPPGCRAESTSSSSSSVTVSVQSWFSSVEALTFQLRFNVIPDAGFPVSVLADLLYRLLLCCLPTNHGGFTADTLLLNSGVSVSSWANATVNLIDYIDQRISHEMPQVASQHSVAQAFSADLLYSAIQAITWNIYKFHLAHDQFSDALSVLLNREDEPMFGHKLRSVLWDIVTLQDRPGLLQHHPSRDVDGDPHDEHRTPASCSIAFHEWTLICLSSTRRPAAHLLRLLAALQVAFFSQRHMASDKACDLLAPWIDLMGLLSCELCRAYGYPLGNPRNAGPSSMVSGHAPEEEMHLGLIAGLLIEALRGILAVLPICQLTLNDNQVYHRLMCILESLFRIQPAYTDYKSSAKITVALRKKQVEVLHDLGLSLYMRIQSKGQSSFLSTWFSTLNYVVLCDPTALHNHDKRMTMMKQMRNVEDPRSYCISPFFFHVSNNISREHLRSLTRSLPPTAAAQFSFILRHIMCTSVDVSSSIPPKDSIGSFGTPHPTQLVERLCGGHTLTLSFFSFLLSQQLCNPSTQHIIENLSVLTLDVESLEPPQVQLLLAVYHSFLLRSLHPCERLCNLALKSIHHCLSSTRSVHLAVYATHLLLLSLKRDVPVIQVLGSVGVPQDVLVETCFTRLEAVVHNVLSNTHNASFCPRPYLLLLRMTTQLVADLAWCLAQHEFMRQGAQWPWQPVPRNILCSLARLAQLTQTVHTSTHTSETVPHGRSIVFSLLITEGVVPILNSSVLYILKYVNYVLRDLLAKHAHADASDTREADTHGIPLSTLEDVHACGGDVMHHASIDAQDGYCSLDPVEIVTRFASKQVRDTALESVWECSMMILDVLRVDSNQQQHHTLMLCVLMPLMLIHLLLDSEPSDPLCIPLPSTIHQERANTTSWSTMKINTEVSPVQLNLDPDTISYTPLESSGLQYGCLWWAEESHNTCRKREPLLWACEHIQWNSTQGADTSFDLCDYLHSCLSSSARSSFYRDTWSGFPPEHFSLIKVYYDHYWVQHLGQVCSECGAPLPQLERLRLRYAGNDLQDRFQRLPVTLRLASALTGAYCSNPLLRHNQYMNVSLSNASAKRLTWVLVSLTIPHPLLEQLELGWFPLSLPTHSVNIPLLSEILSVLLVVSGTTVSRNANLLFPFTQWCITSCRVWSTQNNICRHDPSSTPTSGVAYSAQSSSTGGDGNGNLGGQDALLHILESFHYIALLSGLPIVSFSRDAVSNTTARHPDHNPVAAVTLAITHRTKSVRSVQCTCTISRLAFSCICTEEVYHPLLLLARRVVDLCRVVLVSPVCVDVPLRVCSFWDIHSPLSMSQLHSICQRLTKMLCDHAPLSTDAPFHVYPQHVVNDIRNVLEILKGTGETKSVGKNSVAFWIPAQWSIGFITRGLTPPVLNAVVTQWIMLLRRCLESNHMVCDLPLLLDVLIRAARSVGVGSLPSLLSQLDTRPLLTLLAYRDSGEGRHRRLFLWVYGLQAKNSRFISLLKTHLIRIAYHPLGRRTLHQVEQETGPLVAASQRGLMLATNCSCWVSRCIPRLGQSTVDCTERLKNTWSAITKQLFPLLADDQTHSEHVNEQRRSEHMLRASTQVQLLLREVWDMTSPLASLHDASLNQQDLSITSVRFMESRFACIDMKLEPQEEPRTTTSMQLTTDTFLQMWEMLRCLWGERNDMSYTELEFSDLMIFKAFRAVEPLYVDGEAGCESLDGGALRRGILFLKHPGYQKIISWRVSRAVQVFLTLLANHAIVMHETPHDVTVNPFNEHAALIITLLGGSYSDISWPCVALHCWSLVVHKSAMSIVYPFLPAIVGRLLQLQHHANPTTQRQILELMESIVEHMEKWETTTGSPQLSVFCKVNIRSATYRGEPDATEALSLREPQLARTILCNSGSLLTLPQYSVQVKRAILLAIQEAFEQLHCISLRHLHSLVNIPFPSEYATTLLSACVHLAGAKMDPEIHNVVKNVLARCGTFPAPLCAPLVDGVWWDSCCHFLAVRVLDHLIYPNLTNRVSLYYIQELLLYLDSSAHENQELYKHAPQACCMHHDNPTTDVRIMQLVPDNVKRVGQGFELSRYTLCVSSMTRKRLHPLQTLAKTVLEWMAEDHREVFLRSGLEFSSFLPDVLKFLLPHLLFFTLTSRSENNRDVPRQMAEATVAVLKEAVSNLETTRNELTTEDEFSLFDATTSCQIVFEVLDDLAQFVHLYAHTDRRALCTLHAQSQKNPQLRQSLCLPPNAWMMVNTFLSCVRGVDAARAAVKVGAFSRCILYLESTFCLNTPTISGAHPCTGVVVPMLIDAFRGLHNWDSISGCLQSLDACDDDELKLEQLALDLQSHNQATASAWEYLRLTHEVPSKSDVFYPKALRCFLNGNAFGQFLLEYGKASGPVQALCLPLLMKSLWKAGLWNVLEYLYSNYYSILDAPRASSRDAFFSCTTSLNAWDFPPCTACTERHTTCRAPPMIQFPSPHQIFCASSTWSMEDRSDVLLSGVLSALHTNNLPLTNERIERFSANAVAWLSTMTRESYLRAHLALVPLQLAQDIKTMIHNVPLTAKAEGVLLDRMQLMVGCTPFHVDALDTLKVALEELHCIHAASAVSIHLSKILRKTIYAHAASSPITLCGKYQLTHYLTMLSDSSTGDPLVTQLRAELSKCVPHAMRLEILHPLTQVDDRIAVRHATLSMSTTHLLPEKLQMLQKVVEQYPNSERAHRSLAELLDNQIHDWCTRTFEPQTPGCTSCPQAPLEDLPNFPKGWSMVTLVETAICHHLEAATWSTSTRRVRFHLLKFLQLLVDVFFCDTPPHGIRDQKRSCSQQQLPPSSVQQAFVERVLRLVQEPLNTVPISHWYLEVSQLIARCQHKQLGPKIFQPLLARLLEHMPLQMAWHLAPWFCSHTTERQKTATCILNAAQVAKTQKTHDDPPELHIERAVTFISCLVTLAGSSVSPVSQQQDAPSKNKMSIAKEFPQLARVLASVTVHHKPRGAILLPLLSQLDASPHHMTTSTPIFINDVDDTLMIMRSKQKPKKLSFKGSDGTLYPWLVKKESRGDLRKDARLMEVAGYVNEWTEKVEKAKQKNLKIQRYSVIPLNEVTGLIEWLPHLITLRCAVLELWEKQLGQEKFMSHMKKGISRYNHHKRNPKNLLLDFQETLHHFKPVLQHFFFTRFGINAAVWYECRKTFCESLASWSILGFVLGLGDRHGENILININSGKVVHVDFDCLFGKGLQLPVPEIVPFRLTQNLIAALGVGGLRGGFLSASADTLRVLKQYETDFLSVLQSFVFDPLIEWTRMGKAGTSQQEEDDVTGGGVRARKFLHDVRIKLNGGVNCRSQKFLQPSSTLCPLGSPQRHSHTQLTLEEIYNYVTTWVIEPGITVETQVKELMEAACCQQNLSLMYLGWMPWV